MLKEMLFNILIMVAMTSSFILGVSFGISWVRGGSFNGSAGTRGEWLVLSWGGVLAIVAYALTT